MSTYEVWIKIPGGTERKYCPADDKKHAERLARYHRSISIYDYFVKEIPVEPAEESRPVPDVIAEARTIGAVPKIVDGKLTFEQGERIWARCRACGYEWEPKDEREECPSCGDLDWDALDPPPLPESIAANRHMHAIPAEGPVETRRAAHETAKHDPRSNRERVVALLKAAGVRGLTCDEIEVADGMQFTTAGAIIIDLRMEGWVVQSESEPTRETRRGSAAVVWVHLDYQIPEAERNATKMGKGKWKGACEEAYALALSGSWEDATSVLAVALGKGSMTDGH